MTLAETDSKALLSAPKSAQAPQNSQMVRVARDYGVSPFRQLRDAFSLRYGPQKLALAEYYSSGLYDPSLTPERKKEYLGVTGSYQINLRLSPLDLTKMRALLWDKVMYTALLQQLDLPTTRTQAVASPNRYFGAIPALRNPDAIRRFLLEKASYPIFGKPCEGYGSVGSVLISGADEDGVHLANGKHIPLERFCVEIFADYPDGYIFQDVIRQHPEIEAVTGHAVGTLRMVTIRGADDTPRVLYTVWKIPSPSAMSDNFWQKGSMVAAIDGASGEVGRCRIGTGLDGAWIERHPVSGIEFEGLRIPHWAAIKDAALKGHALFPEFGIVGWDIAIGQDGPILVECNDNPYHVLWQFAHGRGFCNAEMMCHVEEAGSRSQEMLAARIATHQTREKARLSKH
ncbi:sugar-transfer associated ATP-grasp domain-containing protein [Thalassococcus sp. S3]|uniref:sugar-transfer associated ATP-grasp domain-containing protein n=1 Tax=Thalassococcus sp. S3 TaxID=2017482 RepID=UPI00102400D7|nr:sugar-transfer associated ATP-grasp domain-containing protein [Thalassococcus sp. S3]QBF30425.1 hypothetical protein CFI11_04240 [Thalassococcus sp. S3]